MPGVRVASRRVPALEASGSSSASTSSAASPLTPDMHLLNHVNNLRKCCDMSLFYKNIQDQGVDFIADSLLHATDIFAKYATTSRAVASPSKLAGELLKSPTRARTRTRDAGGAAGRARNALNTLSDPFVDAADVFDKENAPVQTRASRSRTASALEPQKGKAKADNKVVAELAPHPPVVKPTRKVLGDLNTQKHPDAQSLEQASKPPKTKASRRAADPEDDSMAIESPLRTEQTAEVSVPRASTPPVNASPSRPTVTETTKDSAHVKSLDAIPIIDSDDSDGESDIEADAASADGPAASAQGKDAEPTVTATLVSQSSRSDNTTLSTVPDTTDTAQPTNDRSDNTVSGTLLDPKLQSARQAASALLTSKLQQQKDGHTEKPAKRTLASYGAKKSLPAAAHNARVSNVTAALHPVSTPAGPGFRSSFLNKSLRKQIADQAALESEDDSEPDSDADEGGLIAGATCAAMYKNTAANTQANTRANASETMSKSTARPLNSGVNDKKRKSDEALPVASEAGLSSAAPPNKISKLSAAMLAAKTHASAPTPAAKKTPAVGPASKLEQFRNNLAHVARSTGSGASSSSAPQSIAPTPSAAVAEDVPASLPVKMAESTLTSTAAAGSPKALAGAEVPKEVSPRSSETDSDSTEKVTLSNKSGESTIKASAIPRSPARSPARTAAASPVRLPPRTGSVRKSPRKLAEQQKANQQDSERSASPGPKKEGSSMLQSSKNVATTSLQAPRSPTTQPRSLAALFGSPKQSSKLPTLSNAAGCSTTPANSPPKHWQGSRLPFAQPLQLQPQVQREADKSLPRTPAEDKAEANLNDAAGAHRNASAASTILSTKAEQDIQFFDARSRENTPERADAQSATTTVMTSEVATSGTALGALEAAAQKDLTAPVAAPAPTPSTKASAFAKPASLSPKKVAAKALTRAGPTSPTKSSALRAAAIAASPSKSKIGSTVRTAGQSGVPAPSTSPSRVWGIGEKIKGFLGLHASVTTNATTSAAQTKISASGTFQPRSNGAPSNTANATAIETKAAAIPTSNVPDALLASPARTAKAPQVNSTPSSAAAAPATTNGKLNSIARAEMLRKKQVEEEERKAKEKEERRRMLMAKKEERAKAVAEGELEKENRKRAREQNDRNGRAGVEDASIASSTAAPAAIPAALLGNIVVGGSATSGSIHSSSTSSRTSAVSSVSSGPPTRPSSALNGSYAGVKSRYMQNSVQQQQQSQPEDSNKKRRVTNDKDGGAASLQSQTKQQQQQQQQVASGSRHGASVATSQIVAPKMVRTVSQSSVRTGPASQAPAQQQQQQQRPQQQASTQPPPQQIKLSMKPGAAAAAGFGTAPRIPGAGAMASTGAAAASMMAAANKSALGPSSSSSAPPAPKSMANANFSSSNPFQQAKQQQLQMQMQKQKQLQMQQQQQQQAAANAAQAQAAANAASTREQELHRAAQLQFQMQNAAGGRFDEWDDHGAQQGGDTDEVLPDIASEYSDSEDEETIQKRAAMPSWTQGDALDAALLAQSTVDADEIFGIPQGPVDLEKILPGERTANRIRRPRTSSANWSGPDGLAQWEIDRYNKRMGIKGTGVQLARRDGSHPPPPPPGVMARLSMAQRQSISHHTMGASSSTVTASVSSSTAVGKKDDGSRSKP